MNWLPSSLRENESSRTECQVRHLRYVLLEVCEGRSRAAVLKSREAIEKRVERNYKIMHQVQWHLRISSLSSVGCTP